MIFFFLILPARGNSFDPPFFLFPFFFLWFKRGRIFLPRPLFPSFIVFSEERDWNSVFPLFFLPRMNVEEEWPLPCSKVGWKDRRASGFPPFFLSDGEGKNRSSFPPFLPFWFHLAAENEEDPPSSLEKRKSDS